jgi:hypothetical protein
VAELEGGLEEQLAINEELARQAMRQEEDASGKMRQSRLAIGLLKFARECLLS